jgi:hypothetical protein
MNVFDAALLLGFVSVWALSGNLPRARLWLLSGAASYALSAAWWKLGIPHHPAFTLFCDASVCLLIYFLGLENWELKVYKIFQFSVLVSLVRMLNFEASADLYPILLEGCNWAVLLLITFTALLSGAAHGNRAFHRWIGGFHRSSVALREARATKPFHQVPR